MIDERTFQPEALMIRGFLCLVFGEGSTFGAIFMNAL